MLPISTHSGLPRLSARLDPFHWMVFALFIVLVTGRAAQAQQASSSSSAQSPAATTSDATAKQEQPKPDEQQDQKPAAAPDSKPLTPEEARQAQIVADTNKLYQLAQELQTEVAKSSKNTLSLAVVKKAAEVEKLAKSLKERMKPE